MTRKRIGPVQSGAREAGGASVANSISSSKPASGASEASGAMAFLKGNWQVAQAWQVRQ